MGWSVQVTSKEALTRARWTILPRFPWSFMQKKYIMTSQMLHFTPSYFPISWLTNIFKLMNVASLKIISYVHKLVIHHTYTRMLEISYRYELFHKHVRYEYITILGILTWKLSFRHNNRLGFIENSRGAAAHPQKIYQAPPGPRCRHNIIIDSFVWPFNFDPVGWQRRPTGLRGRRRAMAPGRGDQLGCGLCSLPIPGGLRPSLPGPVIHWKYHQSR